MYIYIYRERERVRFAPLAPQIGPLSVARVAGRSPATHTV